MSPSYDDMLLSGMRTIGIPEDLCRRILAASDELPLSAEEAAALVRSIDEHEPIAGAEVRFRLISEFRAVLFGKSITAPPDWVARSGYRRKSN